MVEKDAEKAKESKKEKTCMVKIDSRVYDKIKNQIKMHFVEYPSIKNFLEKAAMRELEIHANPEKADKSKDVSPEHEKRHKTWIG